MRVRARAPVPARPPTREQVDGLPVGGLFSPPGPQSFAIQLMPHVSERPFSRFAAARTAGGSCWSTVAVAAAALAAASAASSGARHGAMRARDAARGAKAVVQLRRAPPATTAARDARCAEIPSGYVVFSQLDTFWLPRGWRDPGVGRVGAPEATAVLPRSRPRACSVAHRHPAGEQGGVVASD